MNFDRLAFLSLATALATAACSSSGAETDETNDELNTDGAACIDATVDARQADVRAGRSYPVLEGCYQVGETWGQCDAWVQHFEVGTARAALELVGGAADGRIRDAYDAGYEALRSACRRDARTEAKLAQVCSDIVKMQVASGREVWGHGSGVSASDPQKQAKLTEECTSLLRGIKQESRAVIKACVKKDPTYGVYSCIEGMGFDNTRAKCEDPSVATSGNRTFECSGLGGAKCDAVKALFMPATAETVLGCVEEGIIIGTEGGNPPTASQIDTSMASCISFGLKRSCEKPEAAATCQTVVAALKEKQPRLNDRGYLNAGGRFTKQCQKMLSGLNAAGREVVKACLVTGADRVVKSQLSLDDCAAEARPSSSN